MKRQNTPVSALTKPTRHNSMLTQHPAVTAPAAQSLLLKPYSRCRRHTTTARSSAISRGLHHGSQLSWKRDCQSAWLHQGYIMSSNITLPCTTDSVGHALGKARAQAFNRLPARYQTQSSIFASFWAEKKQTMYYLGYTVAATCSELQSKTPPRRMHGC